MIRFTCDKCERPLEVDDDLAGAKVECPHCGDVNIVPSAVARPVARATAAQPASSGSAAPAPAADDRAAALGLPPDSGPEQNVVTVHPAMFRSRPAAGLGILVLVLGGLIGGIILYTRGQPYGGYACGAAIAAGVGWYLVWKTRTMGTTLKITTKRTTYRRGLLSRDTKEVMHDQIQDLQVHQSFRQRVLGVGTIGISNSGELGVEIIVPNMPNPMRLRKIIDAYRNI